MYRITPTREEKKTLETAITIDAAIEVAKKLSKTQDVVVRDGSRIRVWARAGKATWTVPCKNAECKEGTVSNPGAYSDVFDQCNSCKGYGFHADLPCG